VGGYDRAPAHAASPGYDVQRFVGDPAFLSDVVHFDVPRLGDVAGLIGIHLQCQIGTDTISLARLGARMTGLDLSDATRSLSWNHGMGGIVTALLGAGLRLTMLVEHDTMPWTAPPGKMADTGRAEWALANRRWRAPMSHTLQAVRD